MFKTVGLLILVLNVFSCSTQPCRIEERSDKDRSGSVDQVMKNQKNNPATRVRVYKPDGSLQCQQGTKVSVQTMAAELKPLQIFGSESKHDGLMRTQVCGTPTGNCNVYEILESDLTQAEKLGFKRWVRD